MFVDRSDHISGLKACPGCRRVAFDVSDHCAMGFAYAERFGDVRRQILDRDADTASPHFAVLD